MPTKTIYIREEDQELWKEAEELAVNESLSSFLAQVVREYVRKKEAEMGEMTRIVIKTFEDAESKAVNQAFTGRWLINDMQGKPEHNNRLWSIAESKGGKIVVLIHVWEKMEDWIDGEDYGPRTLIGSTLIIYDSIDQARGDGLPYNVASAAALVLEPEELKELDI